MIIRDFVKRFTKLGAIYGFIAGALYPVIMILLGPILMDIYMRGYNALSTNGHMGYATPEGPVTQPDPVDSVRYIAIALIIYGLVFGVVGLLGGTIAGAFCSLVTGFATQRLSDRWRKPAAYRLIVAILTGITVLIITALVFSGILSVMGQGIFLAIPASLIATVIAVIASQQIAGWYIIPQL